MTKRRSTAARRQLELADLRGRLDEAEQTLQAIRSGEVDALVVSGVDGEQIFTLQGADHSYRILIESMQQGALILSRLGLVLYANRCFAEMLKAPLEQVIGSELFRWVTPDSQSLLAALLQQGHQGHQVKHDCELVLTASDSTRVPTVFSIGQHDLTGTTDHLCLVATDLTEVNARKRQEGDILRQQLVTADQFRRQLQAVIQSQKLAEKAATSAAQYARSLIDVSLDPLVTINRQGQITDANAAMEQVTGVAREQLIGSNFHDYFTEPEKARDCYQQAFSQGFASACPLSIRHRSGQVTEVLYNASVYRDSDDLVVGVFAAARDITERKQIEARLRASEAHLQAIFENEPECIKIVDAQGNLRQMNPAGLAMIEADSMAQVAGLAVRDVIAPECRAAFADLHQRVLGGESVQMEFEVIGLKGGRRWLETHAVPMQDQGATVHLAVTRDITKRRQMEELIRQLAFHDPLTHLPNRRLLLDRLSQTMSNSKRTGRCAALIFLDLDNFKSLNDSHGHGVGDLLLLEVARRLTTCVREIDTVSRFGGDE